MGRTLKALQQLEAKSRRVPQDVEAPPRQPDGPKPDSPVEAAAAVASCEFPQRRSAAPPDLQPTRWPVQPSEEHTRAYAALAEKVLSQLPSEGPACLMFTSPTDAAGTTELLVSLSAALAERVPGGVLAVDANLRNPSLAGRLGVRASRGFVDVLTAAASWPEVVCNTIVPRLRILPGVEFSAPGGRMPEKLNVGPLLEELCSEYPLVLIDAASLAHREAASLVCHCAGTYLVVRLHHTSRRAAAEAARVIRACEGQLLGCVLLGG